MPVCVCVALSFASILVCVCADKFPDNFLQASRNLKRLSPLPASGANVFSILKMDTVIVTQAALEALYERTIEDYESA